MQIFDDITLGWDGEEYKIPHDRVLGAIARIEEIMTFQELVVHQARGVLPLAKLAQAYGSVLRYAGAKASDDQVYAGMFKNTDEETKVMVVALSNLLMMMIPKDLLKVKAEGVKPKGNVVTSARKSSKRSTSSRSAKANGSLQSSSGS